MYRPEELNEVQMQAVLETDGAVLVTAGAGSGKTRLLTHRIAHLIKDNGISPYNILAITFTNKAANEMKIRLDSMLGSTDGLWIFTFHAACVRFLRYFGDRIGFNKDFTIYGEAETKSVIKRICKAMEFTDDSVKHFADKISDAKNRGISPEDYSAVHRFSADGEQIAEVYKKYQAVLKANNALDYDDLLIQALYLLTECTEAREYFQEKFKYIHIDEFQDTNTVQYQIAKILAGKYGNIFAVGDEDQCIYSWRGANIKNIELFQKDFQCKVFKLEQNYRSTSNILKIANKTIKNNTERLDKLLWTENSDGEKVVCYCAQTDGFEADFVVKTLFSLIRDGEYEYSDCAVLMRINALTRSFEERFMQYGIPHRVYGGIKFYERKEVKDILAYARAAVNPYDDEALFRIINFPRRGIGEASTDKIRAYARDNNISSYEVITQAGDTPFPTTLKAKLQPFANTLMSLHNAADNGVKAFFTYLLFDVLKVNDLFSDDTDGETRLENINELVNSVKEFAKANPQATLSDYLQTVSLYSDTDNIDDGNAVTIATVHSAKGLEFPVVFVVGLEDGLFPSLKMNENNSSHIEEERRLMYVAVTRARKRLFLTYTKERFLYGETKYNIPSRFLSECGLVERRHNSADTFTSSPSRYSDRGSVGVGESKFEGAYKSDFGKKQKCSPSCAADKIPVGATVIHKRLGKGKVMSLEKQSNCTYAKIDFERGGVMLLAIDFAPLSVVEE